MADPSRSVLVRFRREGLALSGPCGSQSITYGGMRRCDVRRTLQKPFDFLGSVLVEIEGPSIQNPVCRVVLDFVKADMTVARVWLHDTDSDSELPSDSLTLSAVRRFMGAMFSVRALCFHLLPDSRGRLLDLLDKLLAETAALHEAIAGGVRLTQPEPSEDGGGPPFAPGRTQYKVGLQRFDFASGENPLGKG